MVMNVVMNVVSQAEGRTGRGLLIWMMRWVEEIGSVGDVTAFYRLKTHIHQFESKRIR